MLVQFTGGTFDGATINLQNSLDGVTFVPMYESFVTTSGPVTNVTTPAAVNATAAGVKVYHGLVTPFFRIEITGGTSPTGLKVRVLLVQ
jgi:hypothetical protein